MDLSQATHPAAMKFKDRRDYRRRQRAKTIDFRTITGMIISSLP